MQIVIGMFRKFSARNRIVILFLVIMFLSMTMLGAYSTYNLYRNLIDNTYTNMKITMESTADSLNQSFDLVSGTALGLAGSSSVNNWLNDPDYFDAVNPDFYRNRQKLSQEFDNILIYNSVRQQDLLSYAVVYCNGEVVSYNVTAQQGIETMKKNSREAYESIADQDEYIYNIPPRQSDRTIYHLRKLQSDFSGKDSLVIILATKEENIQARYQNLLADKEALVYLTDRDHHILSTNDDAMLGERLEQELINYSEQPNTSKIRYRSENYVLVSQRMPGNQMALHYLVPYSSLVRQAMAGLYSYFFIIIGMTAVLLIAGTLVSMRSTAFVKDIILAMNRVKAKDYDAKMKEYKDKELNELSRSFNEMTAEIKYLIETTYQSKLLLSEMELKFLHHQINPHFLFNVLLTIQLKAKRCQDETVYQMISSLSALLRASIYGEQSAFITLSEELRYVEFYLYLQKIRFEDRLKYQIEVADESLKNLYIPKLLIVPMVENAVIHGIEDKEDGSVLTVRVSASEADLYIVITDNGVGFQPDEASWTEWDMTEHESVTHEKTGLKNTHQRIRLIYGDAYGMKIESQKQKGTAVTLHIAKQYRGEVTYEISDSDC